MIGTALDTKGGVASVVRIYQAAGLFSKWPVTYLATHADRGFIGKLTIALRAWASFFCLFLWRGDSVLHAHCSSRASFWRKLAFILPARLVGRPIIFHLHGGDFMRFYEQECGVFAKRIVRYVLDNCAKIIVLSESWRTDLTTITNNKDIVVIFNPAMPFGIDSSNRRGDENVLLFLGRMGQKKGIYVLLEAFSRVVQHRKGVRLVCAGDGDLEGVRRAADNLNLADNIEILGWVDEERRSQLLAAASIYVLPSFAEGLPMSILEAMSAGLPIVSTCVGGIPEAVTDGAEGYLVETGNPEALSEAICKLVDDADLRRMMGANSRAKFNSFFSVDSVIPKVEAVYCELGVKPREAF